MEPLGDIYHHGVIVDDLEAAMAGVGAATGVEWAPIRHFDPLPVWTPGNGNGEVRLRVVYSRTGPLHFELIEAAPGGAFDILRAAGQSHLGVWVDDVGAEVERLCANGWSVLVAGAGPDKRYGPIAYVARDSGGPTVELVSNAIRPMLEDWFTAVA